MDDNIIFEDVLEEWTYLLNKLLVVPNDISKCLKYKLNRSKYYAERSLNTSIITCDDGFCRNCTEDDF